MQELQDRSSATKAGTIVADVVKFAKDLAFRDLPSGVVEHAKLVLLDTLGVLLAASNPKYSAPRILADLARSLGGTEESTVIGQGFKSSCVQAALVNGCMGYYCDLDAHHPEAVVHPAATLVPTCLAVGEREHSSGKEFLTAFIVGTDIDCRVSLALNPRVLYERGLHPSCIAGAIAAATSAGRLLNLNSEQFLRALGLAAQQTSGLLAWKEDFSENSRPFNHSIAARNGVTAALLAGEDFGAPPDLFEGRYNIFRAFSSEEGKDLGWLTRGLGVRFLIMDLAFKRYASCAFLHPGLDALLGIIEEQQLASKDIDHMVLRFPRNGAELIDGTELRSHSAQYILPVAAVHHQVMIDDILYDRCSDPEVKRLVECVEVVGDKDLDVDFPRRYASIVAIRTKSGREFSKRVDCAAGTPENPFRREEIEEKFFKLSKPAVGSTMAQQILDLTSDIENLADVRALGALLLR
jgi:2-methylcitrate dehydratase PrpD